MLKKMYVDFFVLKVIRIECGQVRVSCRCHIL